MTNPNFENANCLICHSNKSDILYSFNNFTIPFQIVKCKCAFIYLNPRPTSNKMRDFYNDDYLPHKKNQLLYILQIFTFAWKNHVINKYSYNNKNILDVGAGDGSFGKYMSKKGYEVDSFDKYSSDTFSSIPNNKMYDIVTFWHSIEHFHDIDEIFNTLSKVTHSKTIYIIALPNFNSIDRKIFKDNWIALDVPRHLYHFTSYTLDEYLKKYNISIVTKYRMIQDTFFNIYLSLNINFLIKVIIMPLLLIFSVFLIMINLNSSSSLLYICKKNS